MVIQILYITQTLKNNFKIIFEHLKTYDFSHHSISYLIAYQWMSGMLKYPLADLVVTFVITNIWDAT